VERSEVVARTLVVLGLVVAILVVAEVVYLAVLAFA
jgi:hypothetical protein